MPPERAEIVADAFADRVGEGLEMVVYYTESASEILRGEDYFEAYNEQYDTRSPEKLHEDAVYRLQQADLSADLYDTEVRAECRMTDSGTGVYLFLSGTEGVFLWLAPDVDVPVPAAVDECFDRFDDQT